MLHVYVVNLKIKSHFSHGLKNLTLVASKRERFRVSSSFVLTGDLGDMFGCSLTVVFLKDKSSYKGKFKTLSNIWDGALWASCYRLQRRIQNLTKHPRWSFLVLKSIQKLKGVNYFRKNLHLGCFTGSE